MNPHLSSALCCTSRPPSGGAALQGPRVGSIDACTTGQKSCFPRDFSPTVLCDLLEAKVSSWPSSTQGCSSYPTSAALNACCLLLSGTTLLATRRRFSADGTPLQAVFHSGHFQACWYLVPLVPCAVPLVPSVVLLVPCVVPLVPCVVPLRPCVVPLRPCVVPLVPCVVPLAPCIVPLVPCAVPLVPCVVMSRCRAHVDTTFLHPSQRLLRRWHAPHTSLPLLLHQEPVSTQSDSASQQPTG